MAEVAEIQQETTTEIAPKEKPKVVSAGTMQVVNPVVNYVNPKDQPDTSGSHQAPAKPKAAEEAPKEAEAPAPETPEFKITDDQITSYLKSKGIEVESLDAFIDKVNAPKELPEEEKIKQAQAREKKILDIFIEGGGTVDQFVGIKAIAEADDRELSVNNLKAELKAANFTDEQIEDFIKDTFFDISDEELEQYEDETDREFLKRKKEFASKLLGGYSSNTKAKAQKVLADLNKAYDDEGLRQSEEVAISAKIDEDFKALPRKLTFEIGEVNGKPVSPVEYEVSESDIADVRNLLKNPAKRNNFLFTQDGNLNLENLTQVLVRNKYLESAVKAAYHEGGSRQTAHFEKIFPARSAHELGIGGNRSNGIQKGKVVAAGKVQRV